MVRFRKQAFEVIHEAANVQLSVIAVSWLDAANIYVRARGFADYREWLQAGEPALAVVGRRHRHRHRQHALDDQEAYVSAMAFVESMQRTGEIAYLDAARSVNALDAARFRWRRLRLRRVLDALSHET